MLIIDTETANRHLIAGARPQRSRTEDRVSTNVRCPLVMRQPRQIVLKCAPSNKAQCFSGEHTLCSRLILTQTDIDREDYLVINSPVESRQNFWLQLLIKSDDLPIEASELLRNL